MNPRLVIEARVPGCGAKPMRKTWTVILWLLLEKQYTCTFSFSHYNFFTLITRKQEM